MATVEFNYNGSITLILCPENESMEEICKKFATKIQVTLYFYILELRLT